MLECRRNLLLAVVTEDPHMVESDRRGHASHSRVDVRAFQVCVGPSHNAEVFPATSLLEGFERVSVGEEARREGMAANLVRREALDAGALGGAAQQLVDR